jgi:hypothetical protein
LLPADSAEPPLHRLPLSLSQTAVISKGSDSFRRADVASPLWSLLNPMAQPAFAHTSSLFAGGSNPLASTLLSLSPAAGSSPNNTFTMTASPTRNRKSAAEGYKPKMISTVGAKPACLVNASVTYVGNDQIYAFGGFDQYTDEGE